MAFSNLLYRPRRPDAAPRPPSPAFPFAVRFHLRQVISTLLLAGGPRSLGCLASFPKILCANHVGELYAGGGVDCSASRITLIVKIRKSAAEKCYYSCGRVAGSQFKVGIPPFGGRISAGRDSYNFREFTATFARHKGGWRYECPGAYKNPGVARDIIAALGPWIGFPARIRGIESNCTIFVVRGRGKGPTVPFCPCGAGNER